MRVQDRLYAVALERDLRKSTVIEYKRCLGGARWYPSTVKAALASAPLDIASAG
jgi:hypothetical protein